MKVFLEHGVSPTYPTSSGKLPSQMVTNNPATIALLQQYEEAAASVHDATDAVEATGHDEL